ncbi:Multi antimicrobial extrusion protein [Trema orientale]|uniref:Multi antimicrobial extrusion protein n=1 Tax=Trema orientale TaxID=63057 RepID=A0A2P5ETV0_TREOI|nr:Multi antimicrobial extrusion protein [Trema orientale]
MNKICCDGTRVSNELGAGRPDQARSAMVLVAHKLSVVLSMIVVSALGFGHNIWAGFLSDSCAISKSFASMAPLLLVSIVLDSIQGVLSGWELSSFDARLARGCGWQRIVVFVTLATFYVIGMTVASLLAFKLKLYFKSGFIKLSISILIFLLCFGTGLVDLFDLWSVMPSSHTYVDNNMHEMDQIAAICK